MTVESSQPGKVPRPYFFLRYAVSIIAIVAALLLRWWLEQTAGGALPHYVVFYPTVMLIALFAGLGPGILATVTAALLADYYIITPYMFGNMNAADALGLALFCSMGLLTSVVAGLYRNMKNRLQELVAARTEELQEAVEELADLNEELTSANEELHAQGEELQSTYDRTKLAEQALQDSERIYRAIGETIDYGIWICEPDGRNIYASESFLKLVGMTQEQCSDFGWGDVLHPDDCENTIAAWKECARTGNFWDIEHRYLGTDGVYHDILARGVPVRGDDGEIRCWAGINLDIGRLKRTEESLRATGKRLEILAMSANLLLVSDTPQQAVETLCMEVMDFLGCDLFFNFLLDENTNRLHMNCCAGIPDEDAKKLEWLDMGVAVCGCVARDGVCITAEDIVNTRDPRADLVRSYGVKAYCCHPLQVERKTIGTLSFGTREREFFSAEDIELMQIVAGQVSIAMERKLSLDRLRKNREELRLALIRLEMAQQSSRAGIWDWDMLTGKLVWSGELFRLFGLDPANSEASFEAWRGIIHPEDKKHAENRIQTAIENRCRLSNDYRIILPSGEIRWINATGDTIFDEEGKPLRMTGICIDITDRKWTEQEREQLLQELDAEKARWQATVNNMLDPVTLCDAKGSVTYINPSYKAMVGRPLVDGLSMSGHADYYQLYRPDGSLFPPEELPLQKAALTGKEVRDVEIVQRPINGPDFIAVFSAAPIFDPSGKISGAVAVGHDITELRRTEKALHKSRLDLLAILDNIPFLAWLKDVEGRFVLVNKPFALACGAGAPKTAIGKNDFDFWRTDLATAYREVDQWVMENRKQKVVEELILLNGEERWFETYKSPLFDLHGNVEGTTGVAKDITERKRIAENLQNAHDELERRVAERTSELAETVNALLDEVAEREKAEDAFQLEAEKRLQAMAELREKEQMLMQQGRMAAMGEMIGNIAHQWRQPLNNLGLILQELPMNFEAGDFSGEYLEKSVDRAMQMVFHMSQTIDGFRNFFRPDKEKILFSARSELIRTLELLDGTFREQKIKCELISRDELIIEGYPNEFSQVLLNILINAKDTFVERKSVAPLIRAELFTENNKAVMTITDNAGGIPEEILPNIFDPYFTTKGPDKGTGVGLFISKTIIEKNMQGSLTARNNGAGAEFRIEVEHAGDK